MSLAGLDDRDLSKTAEVCIAQMQGRRLYSVIAAGSRTRYLHCRRLCRSTSGNNSLSYFTPTWKRTKFLIFTPRSFVTASTVFLSSL